MWRLRRFAQRLFTFFTPRRADHALDREIDASLALAEEDLQRRGLTPDQARVAARRAIGGVEQAKEHQRDARSFPWLEDARRDVPYAMRTLARTPSFSVVAILTIAIGIGATTAIFSVVNAVLLQPLPYADADRLVRLVERVPARDGSARTTARPDWNRAELREYRARTRTLSAIMGSVSPPVTLLYRPDGAVRLSGSRVSPELFTVLGATAIIGRTLQAGDEAPEAGRVVVLSAQTWQRHFQADPAIVGKTITLSGGGAAQAGEGVGQVVVVGVMPPSFAFPSPETEFWEPLSMTGGSERMYIGVVAQLADGVSIEHARQEANAIGAALRPPRASPTGAASAPSAPPSPRFDVVRVKDEMVEPARPTLRVFAVAAAVVLLIVCANVANLLLARGTARTREMAVRLAIGAGRGRLVRQVLTESLVLSIVGGLLGAGLAALGVEVVTSLATQQAPGIFKLAFSYSSVSLPRLHEIGVDRTVLFAAMGLSAIVAVIFGIAPAMHLAGVSQVQAMGQRSEAGSSGGRRSDSRLRSALVVSQLALATMLLIGAGLLINSFLKLTRVDTGYDPAPVLTFHPLIPQTYPTARKAAVVEELLGELRRLPGVRHAGFSYAGPLIGVVDTYGVFVPPGRTVAEMRGQPGNPHIRSVSHDYLQTLGVRLLDGRFFNEGDTGTAPPVLILTRTVARRFFGDQSPVGAFVHADGDMTRPPQQIVGVVDDIRQGRIDREAVPQMFMDYRQVLAFMAARGMNAGGQEHFAFGFLSFAVRVDGDPERLTNNVRALVARVDPAVGLDLIVPMQRLVSISITGQRFYTVLLATFAGIAVLLGAVGIYGVLSFGVIQRTQEIGVRMALGAQGTHVLRLVLGRGLLLTIVGMAIGIAGAVALTRYLTGMLFGLTPLDPSTYIAVSCLFAAVALFASYLPARRATKVDPLIALRWE